MAVLHIRVPKRAAIKHRAKWRQRAILIAADLNAAEDEPPVRLLLGEGFVDVARQTCGEGGPCLTATR